MKNSFVMYTDWKEMIEALDDKSRSDLLLAMFCYQTGEELPDMTPTANIAFKCMQTQFDKDTEKYDEIIEKRRIAGHNGGVANASKCKQEVASASKCKQEVASASKCKQNVANQADNVNDNDYKRESTLKGTREKEPTKAELTRQLFINNSVNYNFSARMNESLTDWIDYKIGRKQFYETDVGMKKLLNKVDKEIAEYGEDAVIGVIDDSIANNYQGIIWDKLERTGKQTQQQKKTNQFNNFPQREIDYDDLERQLLQKSYGG